MKVFHLTVFVCLVVVLTTPAAAQTGVGTGVGIDVVEVEPIETRRKAHSFSMKFLCGEIAAGDTAEQGSPLAPGSYRTHITLIEQGSGADADRRVDVFGFVDDSIGALGFQVQPGFVSDLNATLADLGAPSCNP